MNDRRVDHGEKLFDQILEIDNLLQEDACKIALFQLIHQSWEIINSCEASLLLADNGLRVSLSLRLNFCVGLILNNSFTFSLLLSKFRRVATILLLLCLRFIFFWVYSRETVLQKLSRGNFNSSRSLGCLLERTGIRWYNQTEQLLLVNCNQSSLQEDLDYRQQESHAASFVISKLTLLSAFRVALFE